MSAHQFYLAVRLGSLLNLNIRQTAYYQIRSTVYLSRNAKQDTIAAPIEIITCKTQEEHMEEDDMEVMTEQSCVTGKILIKHNARLTEVNTIFLYKGFIELPENEQPETNIEIFCELIQYSGREVDVVGEWVGRSSLHCINSHMEVYFSTHFISCAVSASVHCVVSDFIITNQQQCRQNSKANKFYNRSLRSMSSFYDAAMDPLVQSIHELSSWRARFKELHHQEMEGEKNTDLRKSLNSLEQEGEKFHSLNESIVGRKLSEKLLADEMRNSKQQDYFNHLKNDAHRLSEHLYMLWKDYISLFKKYPVSKYYADLRKQYESCLDKELWMRRVEIVDEKGTMVEQKHDKLEDLQFFSFEKNLYKLRISQDNVALIKRTTPMVNRDRLVVLVHGYQATSFDMEMIAMYLRFRSPNLHILISNTNEVRTEESIEECGQRLAVEVKNFINMRELKNTSISFIGHSMGGIIIRASLPYLQLYKNNFQCYVSLCSPHMGYLYHTSKIVTTSIWLMNKLKKDQSMIELTMNDDPDLNKTFLFQLSEQQNLSWFKSVILIGSKEDEYVPFSSAMMQSMDFFYESASARVYQTVYNNLMKGIADKLIRVEIKYNDKVKDLSGFIGRTAHIKVLSCLPIIELYTHLICKQM